MTIDIEALTSNFYGIELADRAVDSISGFAGVVTARTEHLSGLTRIQLEGVNESGEPNEWWFDACRIEIVEQAAAVVGFSL